MRPPLSHQHSLLRLLALVWLAAALLAGCSQEPKQRAAFISFLQTRILDRPGATIPLLGKEDREQLGVRLLQRTTRKLSLTDVGEAYLRHCQALRESALAAQDTVAQVQAAPRGTLRVSCPVTLAQTVLGEVMPQFLALYPQVRVELQVSNRVVNLVEEGVDVALRVRASLEESGSMVVKRLDVARRMTGWQAFDVAGRDVDEVAPLYLSNGQQTQPSPLRVALATQAACGPTRGVVLRRKDGQRFEVEESASPIIDRQRQLTGAVMVLHDVTETMAMAERMARLAQYDPLTDLPNRVLLQDRARQALAHARRDGKSVAVMYIDLDGFKQINDTLGHDMGDKLLVQLAKRLTGAVRVSDTVCRQGGDEFVVMLPSIDTAEQACHVANKIMAACSPAYVINDQVLSVGLSGGIALFPEHGQDFDELSRHADAAMYAAKTAGRRQFRLYAGADAQPVLVTQGDVQAIENS